MPNLCQLWSASPSLSLKGRLGIDQFDDADDVILNQIIGWVGARFERHCGRNFDRVSGDTQEFDGDATELLVNRAPVESVSAWHLKDNETDGWVAQTGVNYLIRAASNGVKCVVSLNGTALGGALQRLRITYTGGYVLPGTTPGAGQTALPADIEAAAVEQCAHWYQRRHQLGLQSVSGEGGSVSALAQSVVTPQDLLPSVINTLRLHSRFAAL